MDAITLPDYNQLYIVIGGRSATSCLLDLAARLAVRGPVLMLDCGNRANPIPLVRKLRRLTGDPVRALLNVQVARAFTCYQVIALMEEAASRPVQYPVIIFDLLATFYDESVPYGEGYRLLEQALRCVGFMRQSATLVINARPPLAEFPERKPFLDRLCGLEGVLWTEETPPVTQPQQLALF